MNRSEILTTAEGLINGPRASDYGDPSVNFQRIADLWAPILGQDVTPIQVALCLAQLKVARLIQSPAHEDSWIDAAGYVALGGELAGKGEAHGEWHEANLKALHEEAMRPLIFGADRTGA